MVGRLEESQRQFNEVSRFKILLLNDLVTKSKKKWKIFKNIVRNHSTEKCTRISLNVFDRIWMRAQDRHGVLKWLVKEH